MICGMKKLNKILSKEEQAYIRDSYSKFCKKGKLSKKELERFARLFVRIAIHKALPFLNLTCRCSLKRTTKKENRR